MSPKLLCASAAVALCPLAAAADFSLTILHTNDFHARFEPINRFDSTCSESDLTDRKCFGGTARLVSAVNEARARADNSILVDGGDQFQGTLFYTYYQGAVAAEFMNKLEYDAMTVGNHEFDDHPETLLNFTYTVDFPVLMSNAIFKGEHLLADSIMRSTVIFRDGEKIGLVGLTPENTAELSSPGDNIIFTNPVDSVQGEVDLLTAAGVNKIIVLSHSGYEIDQYIAKNTTGIDVIVGGHSNTYLSSSDEKASGPYPTMIGETAIVQAYAYGKFLGELNVLFDDEGNLKSAQGGPLLMDNSVNEDVGTAERLAELAEPLNEVRRQIISFTSAPINGDRKFCREMECEMGNLVADAMLNRVKDQGIEIAITNAGGLRASIQEGAISIGEILEVLPFQNTLSTFYLNGEQLMAALENGVSQAGEGSGRFPQVAGVSFTVDVTRELGDRVSNVLVGGEPLDFNPSRLYGVVSHNYLRGGGDGYATFEEATLPYDFGPGLEVVVAEYLFNNNPYRPYVDGRIHFKK